MSVSMASFSQTGDSTKVKKKSNWEFGIGSGINSNPKPKGTGIANSSSRIGCIINFDASYFITKWLIIQSGLGYFSGGYNCDISFQHPIEDTNGSTITYEIAKKTRQASYQKLYLPVNVLFKVYEERKHSLKLGIGVHKEIAFTSKFKDDVYLNSIVTRRYWKSNKPLNKFFSLEKGDFLCRFSIEYNYRILPKLQLFFNYSFCSNFGRFDLNTMANGSYNNFLVGIIL